MSTVLLLTALFIMSVLDLLMAVVYGVVMMLHALPQGNLKQQRFLTASILNTLTLLQ